MIPYILHVGILLAGCYVFYQALLKNETFFGINRWILVSCVILSFILPLYEVPAEWSLRQPVEIENVKEVDDNNALPMIEGTEFLVEGYDETEFAGEASVMVDESIQPLENEIIKTNKNSKRPITFWSRLSWQDGLWYIYLLGLSIFALNFLIQISVLTYNIIKYPSIKDGKFRIVEVTKNKPPFSFLNHIFINPTKYDWDTYNQILAHEKIHIEGRHTLDILLSELVVVLQWFNPFAWWYRKVVENNLEYLTDQTMLQQGTNIESYQINLLKISAPEFPLNITTNYNQSFLKKRIIMMETKKSSARSAWKYLFLLPVLAFSLISLNTVQSSSTTTQLTTENNYRMPTEGDWTGIIKGNLVCMTFEGENAKRSNSWKMNECFTKGDFEELPTTIKSFSITRTAGTLTFNGKFNGDGGSGTFKFTGDNDFKNYLSTTFKEDGIRASTMFSFFLSNIDKAYIAYVEKAGFKDLEFADLKDLAIHDVKIDDLKKLNIDLESMGYQNLKIEEVTQMVIHEVTSDYIKNLGEEIYKDLSIREVVDAKIHDVNPEYIKKFKEAGYDMEYDNAMQFAIHEIDMKYIESLKAAGLTDLTEEQIVQAAIHEVSPDYLKQFQNSKYKDLPFDNIIQFAIHEIDMDYVEELKKAGFSDLNQSEVVQAAIHEISPEYLKQFRNSKYDDMSFNQIVQFAIHEVDMKYIESLKATGLTDLTHNQIVQAAIHEISPEYLKQFENSKYDDMSFNQIVQFAIHEVDLKYIDALNNSGLDLTYNQMVQAAIHEVSPKYLAQFKNSKYDDMSFSQIIEFAIHDVDIKYIESLKSLGFEDLTHNQIVQFAIHEVDAGFIKASKTLGFEHLSTNQIVQLAIHDVDKDYIDDLRELGYTALTVQETINAKIHVSPRFIRNLGDVGFNNVPMKKLIEASIHGVNSDYIEEMRSKGKTGLTLDEYIDLKVKNGWEND